MSLSAGSFDPQMAGPGAWFDVDSHVSNRPGPAAGWFSGYYVDTPLAESAAIYFIAAAAYVGQPMVAVSPASEPVVVWMTVAHPLRGVADTTSPITPSTGKAEPIR